MCERIFSRAFIILYSFTTSHPSHLLSKIHNCSVSEVRIQSSLWKMDHLSLGIFSHEQQLLQVLDMICYIHDMLHSAVVYYTYMNVILIYYPHISHSSGSFHWKQDIDTWTNRNTEAQILSQFRCWILLPTSSCLTCSLQLTWALTLEKVWNSLLEQWANLSYSQLIQDCWIAEWQYSCT